MRPYLSSSCKKHTPFRDGFPHQTSLTFWRSTRSVISNAARLGSVLPSLRSTSDMIFLQQPVSKYMCNLPAVMAIPLQGARVTLIWIEEQFLFLVLLWYKLAVGWGDPEIKVCSLVLHRSLKIIFAMNTYKFPSEFQHTRVSGQMEDHYRLPIGLYIGPLCRKCGTTSLLLKICPSMPSSEQRFGILITAVDLGPTQVELYNWVQTWAHGFQFSSKHGRIGFVTTYPLTCRLSDLCPLAVLTWFSFMSFCFSNQNLIGALCFWPSWIPLLIHGIRPRFAQPYPTSSTTGSSYAKRSLIFNVLPLSLHQGAEPFLATLTYLQAIYFLFQMGRALLS